ncbi:hypothetical protein R2R70_21290, partial [Cobetia sp. SIMBA_158]|uniref:hypothetical protein n=1 Tax=Cobetia sp. SIMBA_158 TaxID=3081617 RepID=UPI0039803EA4
DKGKHLGIEYDNKQTELYEVDEKIQLLIMKEKFTRAAVEKLKEDLEQAEASIAPITNNPT